MRRRLIAVILMLTWLAGSAAAQGTGSLKGTVSLEETGLPLHNVVLVISQLRLQTITDEDGRYEFKQVPPGSYTLIARLDRMPDLVQKIEITDGPVTTIDFKLKLSGIRDQVTVSATGAEQSAAESFQSTNSIDAILLIQKDTASIGEALEHEAGVSKRSLGPGSSRPVIRGFDGDRVLITQDGIRTGSLSYASGDHGEPINMLSIERVEVVRGPATLLYGTSAIGGMVNAVTGHEYPHKGLRGFFSGKGGTTNNFGGASAGLEFGTSNWLVWGNGGGQRTSDYNTPIGEVLNSKTRNLDFSTGGGFYGEKGWFSAGYGLNSFRYGIPVETDDDEELEIAAFNSGKGINRIVAATAGGDEGELADLDMRRHNLRVNGGLRDLDGAISSLQMTFDFSDYKHQEIVEEQVETTFFNKTYSYRAVAEQQLYGRLTGSFGVSGFIRDFETIGDEALAPPTRQNSFAAFALETIDLERAAFQFGGRVERNSYDVDPASGLPNRSFTGFSGSAGIRVPLWTGGSVSANYTHSYRAPSLDELYNNGPHPGNLTFEIGNVNLNRERGDGLDLSLRHQSDRFRAELNYFYYRLRDFIFLAPTGDFDDGLPVAEYLQGDSRFTGVEANADIGLHPNFWLRTGLDYVNAELTATATPLIRIPPLRGRVGLEFQKNGLRLFPELIMARNQDRVFINEEPTAGYGIVNLTGSYTLTRQHAAHIFGLSAFNLNDKLYRNHLSFIKQFAPEIGRGIRLSYTVRFF